MNNWNNIKLAWTRLRSNPQFRNAFASPVTKIVCVNAVVFAMWRLKLIPESFMLKNFAFDKWNLQNHRYHTMLTHAFSHFGIFSFLLNMIMIGSFGRAIRMQYGNRVIWALYIIGALTGGLFMSMFKPNMPVITPEVGADSSLSAFFTFFALFNLNRQILLFFIPMPIWGLLVFMGLYSLLDISKKNLGGMAGGALVYQLFKMRII